MKLFFTAAFAVLCLAIPVQADHTPESRIKGEIYGMPSWCCDLRDCTETPVRITRRVGNHYYVWAKDREWKVIGQQGHGMDAIYFAPFEKTYVCIYSRKLLLARCAMVLPGDSA